VDRVDVEVDGGYPVVLVGLKGAFCFAQFHPVVYGKPVGEQAKSFLDLVRGLCVRVSRGFGPQGDILSTKSLFAGSGLKSYLLAVAERPQ